jgi:hypothetical protein
LVDCIDIKVDEEIPIGNVSSVLMGLKSIDSTAGTKPAIEAKLDSASFEMEWFSISCNLSKVSMGFVFSGEGSSFSWDYFLFYIFS